MSFLRRSIKGLFKKNRILSKKKKGSKNLQKKCGCYAGIGDFKNIANRQSRFMNKLKNKRRSLKQRGVRSSRKSNRITRRRNKEKKKTTIVGGAKQGVDNESNNLNPFKFLTGNMMSDIKKGYKKSKETLERVALDAKDKLEEAYDAREYEVKKTYNELRDKVERDVKKGIKEAKDKKDSFLCNKAVELMNKSNIAKFDNIDCGGADKQGETLGKRVKGQAPGKGQGQAQGKGQGQAPGKGKGQR